MSGKERAGGEPPGTTGGEPRGESGRPDADGASNRSVASDAPLSAPAGAANSVPADAAANDALAAVLTDPAALDRLRLRLVQLAWKRYSIRADAAEDVVQNAVAAYLEVRGRYDPATNSHGLLYGIFFRKCLEHISASVREERRLGRYCRTPDAARENPWIRPREAGQAPSVLDELVDREDGQAIRGAIAGLRPNSRRLAWLITRRGLCRQELIDRLGVNPNTLDSRLLACRRELRTALLRNDIAV